MYPFLAMPLLRVSGLKKVGPAPNDAPLSELAIRRRSYFMQENNTKQFYLTVKGQKITVSEEVYRVYVRPVRAEQRQLRRKSKCLVRGKKGHLVRCRKDCSGCPYRNNSNYKSGNDLSLEWLVEDGYEMAEPIGLDDRIIEEEESFEELVKLYTAISKLSKRHKMIIQFYFYEGKSQGEIAEILGVSQPAVSMLIERILLRLKKFL